MLRKIRDFLTCEKGATSVEYAIMISLIAIVIFSAVTFFGLAVRNLFNEANAEFANF